MGQISEFIKILHSNVNGIYSSRTELEHLTMECDPDIITINETHLSHAEKYTFPKYNIYRKDRLGRKGGVAIFCKNTVPATEIEIPTEFKEIETIIIKIHIRTWPLYICTIYNPPKSKLPITYLQYLSTFHKLIILTDINAHHPLLGDNFNTKNKQGTDLVELLKNSTLTQILTPGPTRIPQSDTQHFTTPDKILATTQVSKRIQNVQILPPINSDHLPIIVTINTPIWTPINTHTSIETYNYEKADWNLFHKELDTNIDIAPINNSTDIDKADRLLLKAINIAKEKAIPKKKYHTNHNYNKNKLPQTIIQMIKLKRRALRLYQKTRTREDRILYRQLQEEVHASKM